MTNQMQQYDDGDLASMVQAIQAIVTNTNGEMELKIVLTQWNFSVEWLGIDAGRSKAVLTIKPSDITPRHPSRSLPVFPYDEDDQ